MGEKREAALLHDLNKKKIPFSKGSKINNNYKDTRLCNVNNMTCKGERLNCEFRSGGAVGR